MSKDNPTNPKTKTAKPTSRKLQLAKPTNPQTQKILLAKINVKKTQTRAKISQETVDDYAELMKSRRNPLPPIVVFRDKDGTLWLSDGFHRYFAAEKRGWKSIACEVRQGTMHDAQEYAFTANDKHGLRRTNADKRKAVTIALAQKKWGVSDRAIAKVCGVSNNFVGTMRKGLKSSNASSDDTSKSTTIEKRTGLDNKEYPATKKRPAAKSNSDKSLDQASSLANGKEPIENGAPVESDHDGPRALELLKELCQTLKELGLYEQHFDALEQLTADVEALGLCTTGVHS